MKYYAKYSNGVLVSLSTIIKDSDPVPTDSLEVTRDEFDALLINLPTLQTIRTAALAAIDKKAGEVRLRYITSVPGQAETYMMKATEAKELISKSFSGYTDAQYPMIAAEMAATGNQDVQAICTEIVTTELMWKHMAAVIERERRQGKIGVSAAVDSEGIKVELEAALLSLNSIGQ